ncbi:hypothetical protein L3Q82_007894 [Scortum barcoo]|uniref:Uncharacterized protein n=1 Tax=Scortum barcoo TaxID=214431 RepID=A0ACB8WK99_9TELE|nr:hypothetical protein L3Q82_007894 [Scortum barcoo]
MDSRILCSFYRCTTESILTGCITAWYSSCTAFNHKALQRVVKAAQHITRTELPSMEDLYTQRCDDRLAGLSLREFRHLKGAQLGHVGESPAEPVEGAVRYTQLPRDEVAVRFIYVCGKADYAWTSFLKSCATVRHYWGDEMGRGGDTERKPSIHAIIGKPLSYMEGGTRGGQGE